MQRSQTCYKINDHLQSSLDFNFAFEEIQEQGYMAKREKLNKC